MEIELKREKNSLEGKWRRVWQLHRFLIHYYYYYIYFHLNARYLQQYTWNKTVFMRHAVLQLLCMYSVCYRNIISPWSVFCTFTSALSAVCVQCPVWLVFCNSLISPFLAMLFRYCLYHFETVPVAPFITGITFTFTFDMPWIYIIRNSYFRIISACSLITFVSVGIATSIDMHFPCLLHHIMLSRLLLATVLSVCTVRSTIR